MVNQITNKLIGLIKNLKIHIHGISSLITFIIIQYNVLDVSHSILLGRPQLKNEKVSHDWGTNLITRKCNGTIKIIVGTKKLDQNTKTPLNIPLLRLVNEVIDDDEHMLFVVKLDLFIIDTMSLSINLLKNSSPNLKNDFNIF